MNIVKTSFKRKTQWKLIQHINLFVLVTIICNFVYTQVPEFSPHRFITSIEGAFDVWSTFSPDGKSILFSRSTDKMETWNFQIISSKGGESNAFLDSTFIGSATRASWLWDKNIITFTNTSPDWKFSIWVVNGDGTLPRQITSNSTEYFVGYPSWYPNGNMLAFLDMSENRKGSIKQIDLLTNIIVTLTDTSEI